MASLETLKSSIENLLGEAVRELRLDRGELTLTVAASDYAGVARRLRDEPEFGFEQLVDLCGVDYADYGNRHREGVRFCVVAHLLSVRHNWRLRLKVFAPDDDMPAVASVTPVWNSATGSSAKLSTSSASSSRGMTICVASSRTMGSSAIRCARTSLSPDMWRCATTPSRAASSTSL